MKHKPVTGICRFLLASGFLSAVIGVSVVYAQFEAGSYRSANPGGITQTSPRNSSADSTYGTRANLEKKQNSLDAKVGLP